MLNPLRAFGNPAGGAISRALRRFHPGRRPPESEKRKFAQIPFDFFTDGIRPGINIENLSAVRAVNRAWRNRVIHARIHVEPPKTIGHFQSLPVRRWSQRLPYFWAGDDMIRLFPEMYFGQFA